MTDVLTQYCIKSIPIIEKFELDYMLGIQPNLTMVHAIKLDGNNHLTLYLDKVQCKINFNSREEIAQSPLRLITYHPFLFAYLYSYFYETIHLERLHNAMRRM